ncbi:MAG: ATP-binding protein [Desulfuromonadaceae bacterium]|nr:ATP-binding protein [Desulfuromonadaceae bacterium]
MATVPPTHAAIGNKYNTPLYLTLIAAGLAGNYFKFPIFLDIDFLFGSIFAMLALQYFGLGRGILAAAFIAGYTYILWNHPYAIIILTAEVAAVGWLMGSRKTGMVLADTLYWLIIGMPLAYLFYCTIMHVPFNNTCIIMIKQAMNGIANALIARLLFSAYAHRSRSSLMSYREIIYNLLTFFVLSPVLIILAVSSRTDFSAIDSSIRTNLAQESHHAAHTLETWVLNRRSAIDNLAKMAASQSPEQVQPFLEEMKKADANFIRIGVLNKHATTTAYTPRIDEFGQNSIGKNFADRTYLPLLKQKLKPMLSEVVMGRIGILKPRVLMLSPVLIEEKYAGYVGGVLDLTQIQEYLDESTKRNATLYTLVDRNGTVIMTNKADQMIMKPFVRGKGELNRIDNVISQWIPATLSNIPVSERWKNSSYVIETAVGNLAEWKLILEQPVAPFQKMLFDNYTDKLTLLFLVLLAALAVAELLSRRIVATIEKLGRISSDLPAGMASGPPIIWPKSGIKELNKLIGIFEEMSNSIQQHVKALEFMNDSLEQRVEERTNQCTKVTQELNVILEHVPVAISKFINRKQVVLNRKTEDIFQYSKEEMLFRTTRKLYPSDAAYEKLGRDAYPVLAQGQVFETELELIRKDGAQILVRYIGKAIEPSDMSKGTIWMMEDITECKRAQMGLLEANQFSEQVINCAQEGVIVYDLDLRYRVWNPFMEELTGMTAGEVHGRHPSELFPFLLAAGVIENLENVLSRGLILTSEFPYLIDRTGKAGWASNQMGPLRNVEGEIIGIISTVREVTLHRQLDAELRQALENANTVNGTMNRLLRTLAHEFRTPLGLLVITSDILERYSERLSHKEHMYQNKQIRNAALQLTTLINSVVSFNQMETDNPVHPPQLLDVGAVSRIIAKEVKTVWGSGHKYHVTIAPDCGSAMLDGMLFRRILENLLTNAFRYTAANGTISLQVCREKNRLLVDVTDNGIGIPDEDQKRIFDAFYRSSNVEERRGLGLGLSIVHDSLSQVGGTISVTSRVGEGTAVRVEIPVSHEKP